jgi:hypothetical protein
MRQVTIGYTKGALLLCALAMGLAGCEAGVGTLSSAHSVTDAGTKPPDAGQPPHDAGGDEGCTRTQGYWKTHPEVWAGTSLTLGDRVYTSAELLVLLTTPSRGDASLILAKQLIAAKLNVMFNGATAPAAIAEADAWIAAHDDASALPLGIAASTPAGQEAVDIAGDLDDFNNGVTGPGHCEDD